MAGADRSWAIVLIEHPGLACQPQRFRAAIELAARAPQMGIAEVVDWVERHIAAETTPAPEQPDRGANVLDFAKFRNERRDQ